MPVQECVRSTAQFSSYFNMCLKLLWKLYYSFTNYKLFIVHFDFVSNCTKWFHEILYFRFFVFQLNKNLDVKNATSILASIKTTLPIRNITVQQLLQGRRQLVGQIQGVEGPAVIKVGLGGPAGDSRDYQPWVTMMMTSHLMMESHKVTESFHRQLRHPQL
jgi:hypothetical protein